MKSSQNSMFLNAKAIVQNSEKIQGNNQRIVHKCHHGHRGKGVKDFVTTVLLRPQ
jgi:hypothetical protein